ncbi:MULTISPECIES: FecCD family ABC transporter permease [unclassified Rathayibacter]|uniref:FecCD family ABC transporter permease n=1 Tax=unclassified Rathayibacter TaxID=2609250 RepID=UPI0006F6D9D7|nr:MULTISPECIES: iron chelate uptake ABC transporter family permease subunit [unclassified Rathayibacter]KQQ01581.1 iron ABC transporter permease [Rathayibacter sp. Leaf294]KQS11613.1 iron ABC transporter permease [Rathayibacter sp. Leaf185]
MTGVVVLRSGPLSLRFRRRTLLVGAALAGAVLALAVVALGLGELRLAAPDVVAALLGQRTGIARTVVLEWRLPRVLGAVLFGAALGVSGAVFQSLTRNPLASPDIIGLTSGSYAGGLVVIILIGAGAGSLPVAAGSVVGGLIAAALVYLLARRRGVQGFRLIVVGIGVSAMLEALSTYLVLRAKLEIAMTASVWGSGSLNPVGWGQLLPAAVVIAAALVGLGLLARSMRQLELGDDAARALGSPVERTRLLLVVGAVALTAAVTAASGPIAFVALAAPQIARRLTRTAGVALVPSALVGALVLLGADVVAQHVLPGSLPVGVVTVVVGGLYLVGLLLHEARRRS